MKELLFFEKNGTLNPHLGNPYKEKDCNKNQMGGHMSKYYWKKECRYIFRMLNFFIFCIWVKLRR